MLFSRSQGQLAQMLLTWWLITMGQAAAEPVRHRAQSAGAGSVTVVFEAGLGDTLEVWRQVQPRIAHSCARTFAYNRAGYPGSASAHGTRDAATIVGELRADLHARGIAPPYVLVGHSLGGLYMQYFARNYPAEVTGLVLVDATHWQHLERMKEETPGMYGTMNALSFLMSGPMRRELKDSADAGQQVNSSPRLESVPTIVLSSTRASPGETPAFRELMRALQNEEADEYQAQRHEFVVGSGHYIQRDRPEVVIAAVEEVAGCGRWNG